ncbi:hypothetical protein DFH09DRAFT_1197030 [Mycena vulgaris]|nr:hypothetical protein DFH09DRAFT_1197030 [Mycena vulgaris]
MRVEEAAAAAAVADEKAFRAWQGHAFASVGRAIREQGRAYSRPRPRARSSLYQRSLGEDHSGAPSAHYAPSLRLRRPQPPRRARPPSPPEPDSDEDDDAASDNEYSSASSCVSHPASPRARPYPRRPSQAPVRAPQRHNQTRTRPVRSCRGLLDSVAWIFGRA